MDHPNRRRRSHRPHWPYRRYWPNRPNGCYGRAGPTGPQGPTGIIDTDWVEAENDAYNITDSIGIGTDAPSAKFVVGGDASINGVTVGRGGGNISLTPRLTWCP